MLEIRNLTKIYKPKKGVPVTALDNVSLKLPDKGMVFILGKSGSGKSTLLNVLGGLDSYTSGEFIIKGEAARGFKQMHYDSYRNTYIGFIFQEYNILKDFSVGGNIALALELQGKPSSDEEINRILKEVDLEGYGDRKPNELSGGQLQRVAIARALVKNPDIIMADEPTGALDSKTGEAIFETLKKLSAEKLVLIVSHDRDFSERYADRIIELADGKIISDVTLDTSSKIEREEKYEDDKNIVYEDNKINIVNGFELSDDEFLRIKEYIINYNGPVDLNLNVRNRINKKYQFVNTDVDDIEMDNSGFKLIKSKLSLKNSFKIGASGLKYKKAKLVFTILLSLIAFTLFGLADTIASYDLEKTSITSIYQSNIDYASLVKKIKVVDGDNYYYSGHNLKDEDLVSIKNATGITVKGVFYPDNAYSIFDFRNSLKLDNSDVEYNIYPTEFHGCIEFNSIDLEKYGYKLIKNSVLPDGTKDEIMITKYEALGFVNNTLYEYDENGNKINETKIKNIDDLIGKNLYFNDKNFKITGIIDTNMNIDRFKSLELGYDDETIDINYFILQSELVSLCQHSFHALLFVGDGFASRYKFDVVNPYQNSQVSYQISENEYGYGIWSPQMTKYDLVKDLSIVSIYKDDDFVSSNDDKVILSAMVMQDKLYDYSFTNDLNINYDDYNLKYHINGTDYYLLDMSGIEDGISSFISGFSPYVPQYCLYKYALNIISNDYDNCVVEFQNNNPDFSDEITVKMLADYYFKKANSDNGDIRLEIQNENNKMLYELFKKYFPKESLKFIFYYGDGNVECNKKVIGVASDIENIANNFVIVSDDMFDRYCPYDPREIYSFAVGELDKNRSQISKLVQMTISEEEPVKYALTNNILDEILSFGEYLETLGKVFLYIGLGFALFASLLLSNFIATSISYKKQEIGILRAIGSRSNDVFRIFFSEAFIIAMINYVLSCMATLFFSTLINRTLKDETNLEITLLRFGIRQIVVLFVICVVVAFIASFLPVNKNAKKKPIDAIRNR